jgi:hypothetical protein
MFDSKVRELMIDTDTWRELDIKHASEFWLSCCFSQFLLHLLLRFIHFLLPFFLNISKLHKMFALSVSLDNYKASCC